MCILMTGHQVIGRVTMTSQMAAPCVADRTENETGCRMRLAIKNEQQLRFWNAPWCACRVARWCIGYLRYLKAAAQTAALQADRERATW